MTKVDEIPQSTLRYAFPMVCINSSIACFGILTLLLISHLKFRQYKIKGLITYASYGVYCCSFILPCFQVIAWSFGIPGDCGAYNRVCGGLMALYRSSLYFFYTVRLEVTFRDSSIGFTKQTMKIMRSLILIPSLLIGILLSIYAAVGYAYTSDTWGVYCTFQIPQELTLGFGGFDFIVSVTLVCLFVSKLWKLDRLVAGSSAGKSRKKSSKLLTVAKQQTTLTTVMVVSSTIITFGGFAFYKPIAWFWPIDVLFNCFCTFLMFKFVQLYKHMAYVCIFCCPCLKDSSAMENMVKLTRLASHNSTSIDSGSKSPSDLEKSAPDFSHPSNHAASGADQSHHTHDSTVR